MSDRGWSSVLLSSGSVDGRWCAVFERLEQLVQTDIDDMDFERALDSADRLLADAAFDMWEEFGHAAPSSVETLRAWWPAPAGGAARALLILDALSVREMRTILTAGAERGVQPRSCRIVGSAVPTDTDAFAQALGLNGRAQLKASKYGPGFALAEGKPWTDVGDGFSFQNLAGQIPSSPNVVVWDPWLDDLLHKLAAKPGGPKQLVSTTQSILNGDGFWSLVARLRQGRELVITSDHGYAISHRFIELPPSLGEAFRLHFGAKRCAGIPPTDLTPPGVAPLYVTANGRAAVVGPWKWKVSGGYPHLNHGGLTLGEACVPFITFEAIS